MSFSLDNVSFTYPGTSVGVSQIDLTIADGELVAVIGPSGCGKTTVLKLVAGFLTPDSGRVMFDGVDGTTLPTRQRDLGIVFQNYALFPHMTALDNIAYPLKLRDVSRQERTTRAQQSLEMVGLAAAGHKRPGAMSGGQQQRIALARALIFQPRALLLDEPLSALDAAKRVEMRDEIRRLQQLHGIATLHITHDQEEALSLADRVVVMAQGRILQAATPRELYNRPVNRTVAAFVGQANLFDGTARSATCVETPLGALTCAPHSFPVGAAITMLMRPERFRIGAASDGLNTFEGTVMQDRFLGSIRRFDLETQGGSRILVETAEAGDPKQIHIRPEDVQVIAPAPTES